MEPKQVIVIRRDLGMRRGKEIAQGAHASMAWLVARVVGSLAAARDRSAGGSFSDVEWRWLTTRFTKITLQVETEAELRGIYEKAKAAGLEAHLIEDSGKTEFHGVKTATAVAIGPDMPDKIDAVTGALKTY